MSKIITPDGAGQVFASALTRQALSKETDALRRALTLSQDNTVEHSPPLAGFWALESNLFSVTGVIASLFPAAVITEFERQCSVYGAIGPGPMAVYLHTVYKNRAIGRKINKRLPAIPGWIFDLVDAVLAHDKAVSRRWDEEVGP